MAADSRLIPNERRCLLVQAVRRDPLVKPLRDRHTGRERRMNESAAHYVCLGQRQPPAGVRLGGERLRGRHAVRKPSLVPARRKPPNATPLPPSSHHAPHARNLLVGTAMTRASDAATTLPPARGAGGSWCDARGPAGALTVGNPRISVASHERRR